MSWALRFLGVGNSSAVELGSASAVIERNDAPLLMIDCGQEALTAYLNAYPNEAATVARVTELLDSGADITSRKEFAGHVTASAVVLNTVGEVLHIEATRYPGKGRRHHTAAQRALRHA